MQEEKIPDASIRPRGRTASALENFWYHYKWHTLIALFLVVAFTVCTVQMCQRKSYDIYILYAGDFDIRQKSEGGGIAPHTSAVSGLRRVCEDFDGNGEISVLFENLFYLTPGQLHQTTPGAGYEINTGLIAQNEAILSQDMQYSDYYLCILSRAVYEKYRVYADGFFADLTPYTQGKDVRAPAADAVYLSSLSFASLPVFCDLPQDTVVCLRSLSSVSLKLDKKAPEKFSRAETVFRNMLTYGNGNL